MTMLTIPMMTTTTTAIATAAGRLSKACMCLCAVMKISSHFIYSALKKKKKEKRNTNTNIKICGNNSFFKIIHTFLSYTHQEGTINVALRLPANNIEMCKNGKRKKCIRQRTSDSVSNRGVRARSFSMHTKRAKSEDIV